MPPISPSAGVRAIRSSWLAPLRLGGDHERAVLDERAVVDEVGDVLAAVRRPAARRRRHGVGAGCIEPDQVPIDDVAARSSRSSPLGAAPSDATPASRLGRPVRSAACSSAASGRSRNSTSPGCTVDPTATTTASTTPATPALHLVVELHRFDERQHRRPPRPDRRRRPRSLTTVPWSCELTDVIDVGRSAMGR